MCIQMRAGAGARWLMAKSKRHKLLCSRSSGDQGTCAREPSLRFITVARGIQGSNLCTRDRGGSIFTFPGFQCGLKKEVDSHQTGFLFRPFVDFFCRAGVRTSALGRFFFFPPHGVARSSCALTDLRQGAGRCRAGALTLGPASQPSGPGFRDV